MPRAICEDCGSLVEAELTHNGICAVGHYVHCGWGHELSPDDLISDDVVEIIADLEAKLTKAVEALRFVDDYANHGAQTSTYSEGVLRKYLATLRNKTRAVLAELEKP